jgi:hypothetical protein
MSPLNGGRMLNDGRTAEGKCVTSPAIAIHPYTVAILYTEIRLGIRRAAAASQRSVGASYSRRSLEYSGECRGCALFRCHRCLVRANNGKGGVWVFWSGS